MLISAIGYQTQFAERGAQDTPREKPNEIIRSRATQTEMELAVVCSFKKGTLGCCCVFNHLHDEGPSQRRANLTEHTTNSFTSIV